MVGRPSARWCDDCRKKKRHEAAEQRRALKPESIDLGFAVAGVTYEGRQDIIREHVHEGDVLSFRREPANSFDANAIAVLTSAGMQIGYVPRDRALNDGRSRPTPTNSDLARILDSGGTYEIECWRVMEPKGDFSSYGVFVVGKVVGVGPRPTRLHPSAIRPRATSRWVNVDAKDPDALSKLLSPQPAETERPRVGVILLAILIGLLLAARILFH
jgi:hypothetical protein